MAQSETFTDFIQYLQEFMNVNVGGRILNRLDILPKGGFDNVIESAPYENFISRI